MDVSLAEPGLITKAQALVHDSFKQALEKEGVLEPFYGYVVPTQYYRSKPEVHRGLEEAGLSAHALVLESPMLFDLPEGFVISPEQVEQVARIGTQFCVACYNSILRGFFDDRRAELVGTLDEDTASNSKILSTWEDFLHANLLREVPKADLKNTGIDYNYLLIQEIS